MMRSMYSILGMVLALSLGACGDDEMANADPIERTLAWSEGDVLVALELEAPRVGQNPFAVTVNRVDTGAAVTDLTVTAVPDMPAMGHGSSHNVDPIHVGDGRYEGSVNLTMPGEWRIVLEFERHDESLGTTEYAITL